MPKFAKIPSTERLAQERTRLLASHAWSVVIRHTDVERPWVLDLGSGTGKHALFAPASAHYVAYDICSAGRQFVRDGQHFVQGDILHLPFKCDTFDVTILSHALEHFRDLVPVIEFSRRVLRIGGVLGVETPNPSDPHLWDDYSHIRPYSTYALRSLLADHGFCPLATGDVVYPSRAHLAYRILRRSGAETLGCWLSLHLAEWFPQRPYSYACARKTETSS